MVQSIDTPGFHRVDKNGDEVEFVRVFLIGDQKSFADLRPLVEVVPTASSYALTGQFLSYVLVSLLSLSLSLLLVILVGNCT